MAQTLAWCIHEIGQNHVGKWYKPPEYCNGSLYALLVVSRAAGLPTVSPPGVRCVREKATLQGFYDASEIHLVEKRYSVAVSMLPVNQDESRHSVGCFGLLPIQDDSGTRVSSDKLFYLTAPLQSARYEDQTPWRKYGIHLAGICTGISMLQHQVCAFIDSWEDNWKLTINAIDKMVLLNVCLERRC